MSETPETLVTVVASKLSPVVCYRHEEGRVVEVETKIACLPVGKNGWDDWVTGTWQQIDRDVTNDCWIVQLRRSA